MFVVFADSNATDIITPLVLPVSFCPYAILVAYHHSSVLFGRLDINYVIRTLVDSALS